MICVSRQDNSSEHVCVRYRSAVGPATGLRCAGAGAALLCAARPRAAAFLPLLCDALARLPNGEGSRRDIVMLLK